MKGIIVNNTIIKGTVIAFAGDNLGSHQTGGFNENFNAEYFCWYTNNFTNNSNFMICKFNMKNPELHSLLIWCILLMNLTEVWNQNQF